MSAPLTITTNHASDLFEKMRPLRGGFASATRAVVDGLTPAMRKLGQALAIVRDEAAWLGGRSSAERYALTGYCYGKNAQGKKRWLLEQSQRRRRL